MYQLAWTVVQTTMEFRAIAQEWEDLLSPRRRRAHNHSYVEIQIKLCKGIIRKIIDLNDDLSIWMYKIDECLKRDVFQFLLYSLSSTVGAHLIQSREFLYGVYIMQYGNVVEYIWMHCTVRRNVVIELHCHQLSFHSIASVELLVLRGIDPMKVLNMYFNCD